jgi:uncharacterized spore protein YtfJ
MSAKITDIVKNLLDGMHEISKTDHIVGKPAQVGAATVIPIHRLRVGFVAAAAAAGGHGTASEGKTGARGVGGAAQVDPVAVLAIGPDGKPRLLSVDGDGEGTWQRLLHDAPDLVSRLLHKVADRLELGASRLDGASPPEQVGTGDAPAKLEK